MFIYTENSENYKRESATTDDINLLIPEGEEGQTSDEIKWHLVSILQIHYFEFMQKYIFYIIALVMKRLVFPTHVW